MKSQDVDRIADIIRYVCVLVVGLALGAVVAHWAPIAYHAATAHTAKAPAPAAVVVAPPAPKTAPAPMAAFSPAPGDRIVLAPTPDLVAPVYHHTATPKRPTLKAAAKRLGLDGLKCAVVQDGPSRVEGNDSPQTERLLHSIEKAWGIGGHLYCVSTAAP